VLPLIPQPSKLLEQANFLLCFISKGVLKLLVLHRKLDFPQQATNNFYMMTKKKKKKKNHKKQRCYLSIALLKTLPLLFQFLLLQDGVVSLSEFLELELDFLLFLHNSIILLAQCLTTALNLLD